MLVGWIERLREIRSFEKADYVVAVHRTGWKRKFGLIYRPDVGVRTYVCYTVVKLSLC
jgi:hypothetical protein